MGAGWNILMTGALREEFIVRAGYLGCHGTSFGSFELSPEDPIVNICCRVEEMNLAKLQLQTHQILEEACRNQLKSSMFRLGREFHAAICFPAVQG